MCCTFAHLKSHPLTTCFIDHSMMCLTHFLPFVPHHLRLSPPTALPMTGIRRSPCATPHEGLQFGHLVEPTPLTPDHQINLVCASHSLGLHSPLSPASEERTRFYSPRRFERESLWTKMWSCHKVWVQRPVGSAGFTWRALAYPAGFGKCGKHTGKRSVAASWNQHVHASHSWQPGVAVQEPSLPPPSPAGPCPERCFEPPPPLAGEVTNHPPGLRKLSCMFGSASFSKVVPSSHVPSHSSWVCLTILLAFLTCW